MKTYSALRSLFFALSLLPLATTVRGGTIEVLQGGTSLGTFNPYSGSVSGAANYNYDSSALSANPVVGPANVAGQEQIFFYLDGSGNLSFNTIFRLGIGGGGATDWNIAVDSTGNQSVSVSDDGGELTKVAVAGTGLTEKFEGRWTWNSGHTEGGVIGNLVGNWEIRIDLLSFTGAGSEAMQVYDASGTTIALAKNTSQQIVFRVADSPPTANAGTDFSVNEGQTRVALNGSLSSDPNNDPLTYAWVQLPGGTAVPLRSANTASPNFTAPLVAFGGETLSFELTVTAKGVSSIDTVSITVVNVNHPPVAEAGLNQSIAEGSPVTLHGEDSFDIDIDNDAVTYAWTQVSGSPTVTITGANTANPSFTAPVAGAGGAPGVVATLVFELTASDAYGGSTTDSVTVEITNVDNDPTASAGADQTVNENSAVGLNGAASSDPDSDPLTYAWAQVGTPTVTLTGASTATPSFTAPFVGAGGADLTFTLTVNDGYGRSGTDTVVIHVQNINDPPLASAAQPTVASLWPPNHQMVAVGITGVTDPNNNATITITGVTQDEPTNGQGDGDTAIDAIINGDGTVLLRAERSGSGDGRVYRISFTASDLEGSSSASVLVTVPPSVKKLAINSGQFYNSTQ